jgi:ribonuclease HI
METQNTNYARTPLANRGDNLSSQVTRLIVLAYGEWQQHNGNTRWCWQAVNPQDEAIVATSSGHDFLNAGVSNHVASYYAVKEALDWLAWFMPDTNAYLLTPSELVVRQVQGSWKCHSAHLKKLRDEAAEVLSKTKAQLAWLPRDKKEQAKTLARLNCPKTLPSVGGCRNV